jgi:hypothetical protein
VCKLISAIMRNWHIARMRVLVTTGWLCCRGAKLRNHGAEYGQSIVILAQIFSLLTMEEFRILLYYVVVKALCYKPEGCGFDSR